MCTIPFETCLLFIFQTVSDLFNLKYTALNELDDNPTPSFKEQRLVKLCEKQLQLFGILNN